MPVAGAAPRGHGSVPVSAELTELPLCPPDQEAQAAGRRELSSSRRDSAMGEWFAGSAGIWVQALEVLAVSVGFVRGWVGAWQSVNTGGIAILGVRAPGTE